MKKILTVGLVLVIGLTGCRNTKATDKVELRDIKLVMSGHYKTKEIDIDDLGLKTVSGMTYAEDGKLYLIDPDKGELLSFEADLTGKTVLPLQLIKPFLVKGYHSSLYVIDEGAGQLVQSDLNGNRIKAYELPTIPHGSKYTDVVLLDDTIYFAITSAEKEVGTLYQLDRASGEIELFGEGYSGYLDKKGETVYFTNTLVVAPDEKQGMFGREFTDAFIGGENALFEINGTSLQVKMPYVAKTYTADFIMEDDHVITYAGGYSTLDKYDYNGKYLESLGKFDAASIHMQLEKVGDNYLVLLMEDKGNRLFQVVKK